MAVNDGIGNPVHDPFPGISSGAEGPFRAPGSAGASGQPADSASAEVTPATGASQDRYQGSAGTVRPGQSEATVISPGPQDAYVDTGAGKGNPNPYRHPNGAS